MEKLKTYIRKNPLETFFIVLFISFGVSNSILTSSFFISFIRSVIIFLPIYFTIRIIIDLYHKKPATKLLFWILVILAGGMAQNKTQNYDTALIRLIMDSYVITWLFIVSCRRAIAIGWNPWGGLIVMVPLVGIYFLGIKSNKK